MLLIDIFEQLIYFKQIQTQNSGTVQLREQYVSNSADHCAYCLY